MALVVDGERHLLGTLSDGDIRRALLKGVALNDAVVHAMHLAPVCARAGEDRSTILATMRRRGLHQMPVIDEARRVVGLEIFVDFFDTPRRANWVVIMAGGLGTRLGDPDARWPCRCCPSARGRSWKPSCARSPSTASSASTWRTTAPTCRSRPTSAMAARSGWDIRYLREDRALGTAGALSLLPEADRAAGGDQRRPADQGRLRPDGRAPRRIRRRRDDGRAASTRCRCRSASCASATATSTPSKRSRCSASSSCRHLLSPRVLELMPRGQLPGHAGALRVADRRRRPRPLPPCAQLLA
ncbi:MAG: CBS domain-containing protein [Rubrivivax sp.]